MTRTTYVGSFACTASITGASSRAEILMKRTGISFEPFEESQFVVLSGGDQRGGSIEVNDLDIAKRIREAY